MSEVLAQLEKKGGGSGGFEVKQSWSCGNAVATHTCEVGNHLVMSIVNGHAQPVVTGATLLSSKIEPNTGSWVYKVDSATVTAKNGQTGQLVSITELG